MWYEHSPFRNLVDMHIPDWNPDFLRRFDPEAYADCMARAGVDTALIYAGNCLGICFFPTKTGHMHEGLRGRDIFGETVSALRRRGIRPITYFNIWSRWAFDTHPDWRIRSVDGRDTLHNPDGTLARYGRCCLNAPGYREYVREQFSQLARDYDTAGFWIDMTGWHGAVCACGHCRARYLRETGRELPETVDFSDPAWVDFVRARERWLYDFNAEIRRTVDECRPGVTCAFQSAFWGSGFTGGFTQSYADLSDYIAGDFYASALVYSWLCKYLSNVSKHRPMEFMVSRCYDLSDHTTTKTEAELRFSAYAALSHGAAFLFIDAIDPAGTLDARLYDRMGGIRRALAPYLDVWSPAARVLPEVSFYWNFPSMYSPAENGKPLRDVRGWSPAARMENAARTMIAAHFAYDFTAKLDTIPADGVLVLSEQYVLSDAERRALTAFVEHGGRLVVTGGTGTRTIEGKPASLDTLTGVAIGDAFPEDTCYLSPTDAALPLFEGANKSYPLYFPAPAPKAIVRADVEVLATVTRAAAHSQEIRRFGSAISNPPWEETVSPAVTRRHVGKGEVVWLAVPLFDAATERQRKVFENIVRSLLPERTMIETDAPSWLEVMLRHDEAQNRTFITLYKAMSVYYDTPAFDVRLSVALPEKNGRLRRVTTGEEVGFTEDNGRISWIAGNIGDFEQFIWERNV